MSKGKYLMDDSVNPYQSPAPDTDPIIPTTAETIAEVVQDVLKAKKVRKLFKGKYISLQKEFKDDGLDPLDKQAYIADKKQIISFLEPLLQVPLGKGIPKIEFEFSPRSKKLEIRIPRDLDMNQEGFKEWKNEVTFQANRDVIDGVVTRTHDYLRQYHRYQINGCVHDLFFPEKPWAFSHPVAEYPITKDSLAPAMYTLTDGKRYTFNITESYLDERLKAIHESKVPPPEIPAPTFASLHSDTTNLIGHEISDFEFCRSFEFALKGKQPMADKLNFTVDKTRNGVQVFFNRRENKNMKYQELKEFSASLSNKQGIPASKDLQPIGFGIFSGDIVSAQDITEAYQRTFGKAYRTDHAQRVNTPNPERGPGNAR